MQLLLQIEKIRAGFEIGIAFSDGQYVAKRF